MDPPAGEGIQVGWTSRYQCFPFPGSHLRDLSLMQYDTADQLHIIMKHIPGDLSTGSKPFILMNCFIALYTYIPFGGGQITVHFRCRDRKSTRLNSSH